MSIELSQHLREKKNLNDILALGFDLDMLELLGTPKVMSFSRMRISLAVNT